MSRMTYGPYPGIGVCYCQSTKGVGTTKGENMRIQTKAKCAECERVFDLLDEDDAAEWYYGHDCES